MIGVRRAGIIIALTSSLATIASAQIKQVEPVGALKGHNSNAPVDVQADRIEVQDRADRAVFTGKDRKSTRLNSSHYSRSRMPSSA